MTQDRFCDCAGDGARQMGYATYLPRMIACNRAMETSWQDGKREWSREERCAKGDGAGALKISVSRPTREPSHKRLEASSVRSFDFPKIWGARMHSYVTQPMRGHCLGRRLIKTLNEKRSELH
jgi:hypothetical protein